VDNTDYYAILGLDRRCTAAQVRSAYRLLVKRHHPDLNRHSSDATARAQALNAAYETLIDPLRRADYDRDLRVGEMSAAPRRVPRASCNIAQDVGLSAEDLIRGVSLQVKVNDPANPLGAETYTLDVPEETPPGARFRLPRDEPFEGGFVVVRVKALPGHRFKVRGTDLRCDLRITPQRAAQGGSEMIPGATGRMVRVEVPAGVARNAIVRVAGEGLPKARGGRGDLLVRITYRPEVDITRNAGGAGARGFRKDWKRLS